MIAFAYEHAPFHERAYPAPPARVVIATGEVWSVSARVTYPPIPVGPARVLILSTDCPSPAGGFEACP